MVFDSFLNFSASLSNKYHSGTARFIALGKAAPEALKRPGADGSICSSEVTPLKVILPKLNVLSHKENLAFCMIIKSLL